MADVITLTPPLPWRPWPLPQYFGTVNLLRMSHLMLGFALNEQKRQRVIKVGLREIKNCSCLPSPPPPATDGVEVEWKVKGAGFEEKGWRHTAFDDFTAGQGEGIYLLPVCIKDKLVERQWDQILSSNLNIPLSLSDYCLMRGHSFNNQRASGAVTLTREGRAAARTSAPTPVLQMRLDLCFKHARELKAVASSTT